ncbi:hypothetical protein KGF86_01850 [Ornithinibacillus massiliensis]|uniref:Uncharacterized protein n=1 Tax=Ornithinibacillus massiliensis TaxID=1944633 RepID=A0ABS5MAY6_9BACI|nr:hypothetical protein [Ornithinibacillus massiliensis]MBS3678948.1 hypothetical protein [Ornithinibacillus massiliensis]
METKKEKVMKEIGMKFRRMREYQELIYEVSEKLGGDFNNFYYYVFQPEIVTTLPNGDIKVDIPKGIEILKQISK